MYVFISVDSDEISVVGPFQNLAQAQAWVAGVQWGNKEFDVTVLGYSEAFIPAAGSKEVEDPGIAQATEIMVAK